MASWRAGLSAGLTRFLLAETVLCSVLYVLGFLGFAGAAYGALSGDPGSFFDMEVQSAPIEEVARAGASGREGTDPYLADFFSEIAGPGLRPDIGGPSTYMAGDNLVFYRVAQTGTSGAELRFLDCHEALRLFRAAKLVLVVVLLASFAAFAVLGRRLAEAAERERALSDEIAGRLLHDVKTPLASLLAAEGEPSSGTAMRSEGDLGELADAFDRLLLLRSSAADAPRAIDAREMVFDVARLVDRDVERPGSRLVVVAPESVRVVCDEQRVVAVLYCVTRAALAEADGCVRLFARSGAAVTLGVAWDVVSDVPGNKALTSLIKRFSAAEACEVQVETDSRRRQISFTYPTPRI